MDNNIRSGEMYRFQVNVQLSGNSLVNKPNVHIISAQVLLPSPDTEESLVWLTASFMASLSHPSRRKPLHLHIGCPK